MCRDHFLYCAILIEEDSVDACRTVLVEMWRIVVVVVEQIPLSSVFHQRMVIGPAAGRRLVHYDPLIFERSERVVTHGICQSLSVFPHPRICQIIPAITFECERALLEAFRQRFVKSDLLTFEFEHVVRQPAAA